MCAWSVLGLWTNLLTNQLSAVRVQVKEKNVEILEEAARVTYALGGGQTVFCKSGKDRTAMCVTLQQSKALGEKHGCGSGTERVSE